MCINTNEKCYNYLTNDYMEHPNRRNKPVINIKRAQWLTIWTSMSSSEIGGESGSRTSFDWTWARSDAFGPWTTQTNSAFKKQRRSRFNLVGREREREGTGYERRSRREERDDRRACMSSIRCVGVGGVGPSKADSIVARSSWGETIVGLFFFFFFFWDLRNPSEGLKKENGEGGK